MWSRAIAFSAVSPGSRRPATWAISVVSCQRSRRRQPVAVLLQEAEVESDVVADVGKLEREPPLDALAIAGMLEHLVRHPAGEADEPELVGAGVEPGRLDVKDDGIFEQLDVGGGAARRGFFDDLARAPGPAPFSERDIEISIRGGTTPGTRGPSGPPPCKRLQGVAVRAVRNL